MMMMMELVQLMEILTRYIDDKDNGGGFIKMDILTRYMDNDDGGGSG